MLGGDLQGKNILIGVCGSIAAYKSAFLVRALVKEGANVKVIMTPSGTSFITPITLSTLSRNPVLSELTTDEGDNWNSHVELGLWADYFLIAPATANTLAKMANGICDNLLLAAYLSAKCPVLFAPAMDLDMWAHASTQNNIEKLQNYGNELIPVETGELASGLVGEGRMAEPDHIIDFLKKKQPVENHTGQALAGKRILITAGPTYEPIDPVRFIGNRSSGKMGFALARRAAQLGAEVTLIKGPTNNIDLNGVKMNVVEIETAEDMYAACIKEFEFCDIAIMAAAVADYSVEEPAESKIKKEKDEEGLVLNLKKTRDILKELGSIKKDQFLVGFALETDNELENAIKKLHAKNLDFIVLNSLKDEGAGFQTDTNKIKLVDRDENITEYELKSKEEVAKDILDRIIESI
ncbi:MAG: bifunctional phosphopantothenoylcysteine decarboxylase/phosphopantothenate--cysteine ligase CoaBC [Bacteroidetes bacterium]|nr:bifunctional phosphopantothenoylcysteine decarboxylase/phosphopantothenate--cysteine ligase CoaBC [Bacteroidota bacterium]